MMPSSDDVLFEYVSQGNPKSNDDFRRFLQLYPEYREELIDFTATWRAMAILDTILPPTPIDPLVEREMLHCARAHARAMCRRRSAFDRGAGSRRGSASARLKGRIYGAE
jgi:uncharacterized protein YfaA (DUF2138 family)